MRREKGYEATMRALMQAPEQVVPSRHVIDAVWHYDEAVTRKMMAINVR